MNFKLSVIISFIIYSIIFEFDEIIFISILSLTLFGIVGLIDDLKKIKKTCVVVNDVRLKR